MARIRTVKPEYWTSAQVMECSPISRLLFIGMWNFADDTGRMTLSPRTLKAQLFPSDDLTSDDIRRMILELARNDLVGFYVIDNKEYLQITGWQHQRIDKPQPSKYPPPAEPLSKNVPGSFLDGAYLSLREGKGGEWIGDAISEDADRPPNPLIVESGSQQLMLPERPAKKPRAKPKAPIAPDWKPSNEDWEHAAEKGFAAAQIDAQAEKFRNHHLSKGSMMADWAAAWRTWISNSIKWDGPPNGRAPARSRADTAIEGILSGLTEEEDLRGRNS